MKQLFSSALLLLSVNMFAQNVGIGNGAPASKLEINNNSLVRPSIGLVDSSGFGLGNIRFKNSTRTNRYMELEGLTYSAFSRDNYIDVKSDSIILATFRGDGTFGIGTISPTERLHVNGNMNITGSLKVNGSAGTAGQVLTSNGSGAPQWRTASGYATGGRAMIPTTRTNIPYKLERNLRFGEPVYNTFSGAITITDSAITFNEEGLYELEGKILFLPGNITVNATGGNYHPAGSMRILANYPSGPPVYFPQIEQAIDKTEDFGATQAYYRELIPFRFVTHIPAGTTFSFPVNINRYNGDVCCDAVAAFEGGYIAVMKLD